MIGNDGNAIIPPYMLDRAFHEQAEGNNKYIYEILYTAVSSALCCTLVLKS